MSARFEVVRTDAGHFARFIAANGKEVWRTSEVYTRKRGAENAIECIVGRFIWWVQGSAFISAGKSGRATEVRFIDKRDDHA